MKNIRNREFKSILLTGAATAIITGMVVLPGNPAHAQRGVILQPTTGWSIKNIKNADKTSSYCAIARRYRNDVILSVAQNHHDESSVALDFKSEAFDMDQSFDVVLDAGSGQVRYFDVYPVSRKAFVVRLGRDDTFFDALNRTGQLRVEIQGKVYNFNLSDISRGRNQLDKCLSGNERFAAPKPLDNSNVKAENTEAYKELADRLAALEEKNLSLKEELGDVKTNNLAVQAVANNQPPLNIVPEVDVPPVPSVPPPANALDYRKERQADRDQENRLQDLLRARPENSLGMSAERQQQKIVTAAKLKNSQDLTEEEKMLLYKDEQRYADIRTLDYLKKENEELRRALQNNPHASQELNAMKVMADQLSAENTALTDQLALMHEHKAEYLSQIGSLQGQKEELTLALEDTEMRVQEITQKATFLDSKILALETENEDLKNNIALTRQQLDVVTNERNTIEQEKMSLFDRAKDQITEMAEKLRISEEKNTGLTADLQANTQLQNDLSAEIEQIRADNLDLRNKLDEQFRENEITREETLSLSHRISELRGENDALQADLEKASLEIKTLKAEIENNELEYTKQLEEQKAATLSQALSYKTQISSLEQEIELAKVQNIQLAEQLGAEQKDKVTLETKLETKDMTLLEREGALQAKEERLNEILETKAKQEEKINSLQEQLENLKQQQAEFTEKHSQVNQQFEEQLSRKDSMIAELRAQNAKALEELKAAQEAERQRILLEKEQELEALRAQKQAEMEALSKTKNAEFETKQEDLEKQFQQELEKRASEIELLKQQQALALAAEQAEIDKIAQEQRLKKEAELAALKAQYQKELDETLSLKEKELSELALQKAEQEAKEEELRLKKEAELAALKAQYQKELEEQLKAKEAAAAAALAAKDAELAAQQEKMRAEFLRQMSAMAAEFDALKQQQLTALQEQELELDKQLQSKLRAKELELAELKEQQEQRYKEQSAKMQLEYQKELQARTGEMHKMKVEHDQALRTQKVSQQEALQQELLRKEAELVSLQREQLAKEQAIQNAELVKQQEIAALQARVQQEKAALDQARLAAEARARSVQAAIAEEERIRARAASTASEVASSSNKAPETVVSSSALSEAQRAEMEMRRSIAADLVPPPAPVQPAKKATPELVVIDKMQEDLKPAVEVAAETVKNAETVTEKVVNTANAQASEPVKKMVEVVEAVAPVPAPAPQFKPTFEIEAVLSQAHISPQTQPTKLDALSGQEAIAYQWRTESLYGSSQQRPIAPVGYKSMVEAYLNDTKNRCSGDFAVVPSNNKRVNNVRIDSYEIACIGSGVESSASLLFTDKEGVFTVIAHEGGTDDMEVAMDVRDKIASSIN